REGSRVSLLIQGSSTFSAGRGGQERTCSKALQQVPEQIDDERPPRCSSRSSWIDFGELAERAIAKEIPLDRGAAPAQPPRPARRINAAPPTVSEQGDLRGRR